MSSPSPASSPRQERRKARTRERIAIAANELFMTRGYSATSMDDIAEHADVAMRTIYLHFESKAAVMLAFVDDWIEAFLQAVLARPVDEPVATTVDAALAEVRAGGRQPRDAATASGAHAVVDFFDAGPGDIAGHVMQSWVKALERMAADVAERGGYPPEALEPRARSGAIFGTWMATMLAFRAAHARGVAAGEVVDHDLAVRISRMISAGSL